MMYDISVIEDIRRQMCELGKLLDSSVIQFILTLYNDGLPCFKRSFLLQFLYERKIYRKLRLLRKHIRLRGIPNYKALNLMRVFYFSSKVIPFSKVPLKNWVYAYAHIMSPGGTLIVYYFPRNISLKLLYNLAERLHVAEEDIFISSNTLYPKLAYINNKFVFRFNNDNFGREKDSSNDSGAFFDFVDVLIVKELEKDALMKFSEIAKNVRVDRGEIYKHYIRHVCRYRLIERVAPTFMVDKPGNFINLLLYSENFEVLEGLCKALNSFSSIHITEKDHSFIFSTKLSLEGVLKLSRRLHEKGNYKFKLYLIDPESIRRFTIPYEKFSSNTNAWEVPVKINY